MENISLNIILGMENKLSFIFILYRLYLIISIKLYIITLLILITFSSQKKKKILITFKKIIFTFNLVIPKLKS